MEKLSIAQQIAYSAGAHLAQAGYKNMEYFLADLRRRGASKEEVDAAWQGYIEMKMDMPDE